MLGSYEGADGLKTGYTNASGFNLVMSAMRDNRRLIGVVMGGDSAGQRDRMMADADGPGLRHGGDHAALGAGPTSASRRRPAIPRPISIPAWSFPRARRGWPRRVPQPLAGFTAAAPPPATRAAARAARRQPGRAGARPGQRRAPGGPSIGSWVIQVGSFSDPQAAQLALERAASTLADMSFGHATAVDEVQMANKTFHRARLTNLSQGQAVDGCKRLEKKKIYCSAIQVTAWNTPGAR